MLVRVSDWAWMSLDGYPSSKLSELKERLTLTPKKTSEHQEPQDLVPLELFREGDGCIGVPRSFFYENGRGLCTVVDNMSSGREVDLEFSGELKPDQQKALEVVVENSNEYGAIVKAKPGWGKTVFGIRCWIESRRSGIVFVDKSFLLDQWKDRIKRFAPAARIGVIQQDTCQFGEDYDISIAMMQSVLKRRDSYPEELWSSFGFGICDEVHKIGAPLFSQVLPSFNLSYFLGLSATPKRRDGMDEVLHWFVGPIIYESKEKRVVPRLRRVFTNFSLKKMPSFDPNRASKEVQLRFLCKNPERNDLIISELVKAVSTGRKVMVLSGKRNHLEWLKEKLDTAKLDGITSDFFVGGRKQEELAEAEKANVVFATYHMAKEGLDIPSLDTLFLVTPVADVEQSVGRIMREYHGKKDPVVTDFIDNDVSRFRSLWTARMRFYMKEGLFKNE
jgi:superfamily II DNA or RNA helicase